MRDAEAGRGHGFEPVVADALSARIATAIGAVVETAQRVVDVGELGLDLLEDGEILVALECLGRDVGGMRRDM